MHPSPAQHPLSRVSNSGLLLALPGSFATCEACFGLPHGLIGTMARAAELTTWPLHLHGHDMMPCMHMFEVTVRDD